MDNGFRVFILKTLNDDEHGFIETLSPSSIETLFFFGSHGLQKSCIIGCNNNNNM
jgi:hypothetical protein